MKIGTRVFPLAAFLMTSSTCEVRITIKPSETQFTMSYSSRSLPIGIVICEMTRVLELELQSRHLAHTIPPVVILIYTTYSSFLINEADWYAGGVSKIGMMRSARSTVLSKNRGSSER